LEARGAKPEEPEMGSSVRIAGGNNQGVS